MIASVQRVGNRLRHLPLSGPIFIFGERRRQATTRPEHGCHCVRVNRLDPTGGPQRFRRRHDLAQQLGRIRLLALRPLAFRRSVPVERVTVSGEGPLQPTTQRRLKEIRLGGIRAPQQPHGLLQQPHVQRIGMADERLIDRAGLFGRRAGLAGRRVGQRDAERRTEPPPLAATNGREEQRGHRPQIKRHGRQRQHSGALGSRPRPAPARPGDPGR